MTLNQVEARTCFYRTLMKLDVAHFSIAYRKNIMHAIALRALRQY